MPSVTATSIHENFHKAFPNDIILVHKYNTPGGTGSFYGNQLLKVQLEDRDWLRVYKLSKSSRPVMNSAEIKRRAFPFVYDTQRIRNPERRRDVLRNNLKNILPDHYVNVGIFGRGWSRYSRNTKGVAYFDKEYGTDIDIVLS